MKICTPESAVACIESGQRVYLHEGSMVPQSLLQALVDRATERTNVELLHLHIDGPAPHVDPKYAGHLRHTALLVGGNTREAIAEGRADFLPVSLGAVPLLFRRELSLDVALVQVCPPDEHGYCRLGLSVGCAQPAVETARIVIAELNPQVPRTAGNSTIHVDEIDFAVEVDRPLPRIAPVPFTANERAVGEHVASLVPNGATICVGAGTVPNAVMAALGEHQDLGVHTELFSDGLLKLVRRGVITGRHKARFQRRLVTSFATGSLQLHEFVDDNPFVEFHPSDVVNSPNEIRKQHSMVAINTAPQIDLTGQVRIDSMGDRIHGGVGGPMDFVQGALACPGGRSVIALPSTARNGEVSRIVPQLPAGAEVITPRGQVQWVVTEHGAANLRGLTLRERAEQLIRIAHPDHRDKLRASTAQRRIFGLGPLSPKP